MSGELKCPKCGSTEVADITAAGFHFRRLGWIMIAVGLIMPGGALLLGKHDVAEAMLPLVVVLACLGLEWVATARTNLAIWTCQRCHRIWHLRD